MASLPIWLDPPYPTATSQLLGTVGAVDVLAIDHKALIGQRQGALLAVEAVLVPCASLIVHYVSGFTKPWMG